LVERGKIDVVLITVLLAHEWGGQNAFQPGRRRRITEISN